jgi:hypothetical protein
MLNYPSNPSLNDVYSYGDKTWTFNGVAWDLSSITLTTSSVIEGANLYFTNSRVVSALTSGENISIASNGLITSNVVGGGGAVNSVNGLIGTIQLYTANIPEVNNLYFTNARSRATLSASTGVRYDSATGAISIGQNVDTTANVTFGIVNITGNLNVYGNAVNFQANTLIINDPLLQVGFGNPSDALDLGFVGHYNDGVERHAGFFRDASDSGRFKVFDNLPGEPDGLTVNTANASFRLATLVANVFEGNVSWNNITNRPTTDGINEGSSNLYFTNTRSISSLTAGTGINLLSNGFITSTSTPSAAGGIKSVTVVDPIPSDSITMFFTRDALTITSARAIIMGSSANVVIYVASSTNRTTPTTNNIVAFSVTNTTAGHNVTVTNTTIAANSWVWLTTPVVSGTANSVSVTLIF